MRATAAVFLASVALLLDALPQAPGFPPTDYTHVAIEKSATIISSSVAALATSILTASIPSTLAVQTPAAPSTPAVSIPTPRSPSSLPATTPIKSSTLSIKSTTLPRVPIESPAKVPNSANRPAAISSPTPDSSLAPINQTVNRTSDKHIHNPAKSDLHSNHQHPAAPPAQISSAPTPAISPSRLSTDSRNPTQHSHAHAKSKCRGRKRAGHRSPRPSQAGSLAGTPSAAETPIQNIDNSQQNQSPSKNAPLVPSSSPEDGLQNESPVQNAPLVPSSSPGDGLQNESPVQNAPLVPARSPGDGLQNESPIQNAPPAPTQGSYGNNQQSESPQQSAPLGPTQSITTPAKLPLVPATTSSSQPGPINLSDLTKKVQAELKASNAQVSFPNLSNACKAISPAFCFKDFLKVVMQLSSSATVNQMKQAFASGGLLNLSDTQFNRVMQSFAGNLDQRIAIQILGSMGAQLTAAGADPAQIAGQLESIKV